MTVQQPDFARAVLDPTRPVPDGLHDAQARPAGRRFDVYRNNVIVSLSEALGTAFPVIARLLGPENMTGLAGLYVRAHPPETPLMMHFGAAFPGFLENLPQLAHLGYLADVARLELALRRSYHAADADPLDPARLNTMSPDALIRARVGLAPAVELVPSVWPLFDIWRFNTAENAPQPGADPQAVLITRADFDPVPALLTPGGAACVQALAAGHPIGDAYEAGLEAEVGFDLGGVLTLLLDGRAITSVTTED